MPVRYNSQSPGARAGGRPLPVALSLLNFGGREHLDKQVGPRRRGELGALERSTSIEKVVNPAIRRSGSVIILIGRVPS